MDTKKFLIGTVVGGIVFFFLGYLFYGLLFMDFFIGNPGSATGVYKTVEEITWWSLILGNFAGGGLLTYIFLKWAHISTFKSGLRAGVAIGFLMTLSWYLVGFGTSNLLNLQATLVAAAIDTIMIAIAGGAIGAVLPTKSEADHEEG